MKYGVKTMKLSYENIIALLGKEEDHVILDQLIQKVGAPPTKLQDGQRNYFCFDELGFELASDADRGRRFVNASFYFPTAPLEAKTTKQFNGGMPSGITSHDTRHETQKKLGIKPIRSRSLTQWLQDSYWDHYELPPHRLGFLFDHITGCIKTLSVDYTDDLTLESTVYSATFSEPCTQAIVARLPRKPLNTDIQVVCLLPQLDSSRLSRIVAGPNGMYFGCGKSIWFLNNHGQVSEYATIDRIGSDSIISGIRFGSRGVLFVLTSSGVVFKVNPDKSAIIVVQLDGASLGDTFSDLVIVNSELFISTSCLESAALFKIDRCGDDQLLCEGSRCSINSLLADPGGSIWGLNTESNCLVKVSQAGSELSRVNLADSGSFSGDIAKDGALAMDSMGQLYAIVGASLLRIDQAGGSEVFLDGLLKPSGVAFASDGGLYVLESGRAQILRVKPEII